MWHSVRTDRAGNMQLDAILHLDVMLQEVLNWVVPNSCKGLFQQFTVFPELCQQISGISHLTYTCSQGQHVLLQPFNTWHLQRNNQGVYTNERTCQDDSALQLTHRLTRCPMQSWWTHLLVCNTCFQRVYAGRQSRAYVAGIWS